MRIIITILLFLSLGVCHAQQQPLYTQFMYNKQVYNPAYVPVESTPSIGLVYRSQWIGIEGAPNFQGLSFAMPLRNDRIGLGINLRRVSVGLTSEILLEGLYGYRFELGVGSLSLGMQLSLKSFNIDFNGDNVFTSDGISNDPAVQDGSRSNQVFNFGLGAYYRTDNFFFGLSVPRVQNVDLNANSEFNLSKEERHIYGMLGASFDMNEDISFTPQLLYRWVKNTPADLDANLSVSYLRKYTVGITYRLGGDSDSFGESLDLILSMHVNENILVGFAYDYTLSEIRRQSSGSLEFISKYRFGERKAKEDSYINPRYF